MIIIYPVSHGDPNWNVIEQFIFDTNQDVFDYHDDISLLNEHKIRIFSLSAVGVSQYEVTPNRAAYSRDFLSSKMCLEFECEEKETIFRLKYL